MLRALLEDLEHGEALEAALEALRRARPESRREPGWGAFRAELESRAQQSLERRRAQWHLDPRRRRWRLRFSVRAEATQLGPSGLQARLGERLLSLGLPLALTLTKHPKPSLHLGPILPLGMEGDSEWADLDLSEPAAFPPSELPARFGTEGGLAILDAEEIPLQASALLELARSARWTWPCPPESRELLERFAAASTWEIEKTGKEGGRKVIKRLEVRDQVLSLAWEDGLLHLETRLQEGAGMNPRKLLAGILGLPAEEILGLRRDSVPLSEDPRLADRDRYETRLHNMFEDAVLLECGPAPEPPGDDDEVIRL